MISSVKCFGCVVIKVENNFLDDVIRFELRIEIQIELQIESIDVHFYDSLSGSQNQAVKVGVFGGTIFLIRSRLSCDSIDVDCDSKDVLLRSFS